MNRVRTFGSRRSALKAGSATDLAKRIREMSNGRLNIQVFGVDERVPAFEGFDAGRAGTVEMNHANSYFWRTTRLKPARSPPPFGWALFYLKGVAPPEVTIKDIYKGVVPFIVLQAITLALAFLYPSIALWLPKAIGW